MIYRTLEGVLHPDGRLTLPAQEMPQRPVHVMVTLLTEPEDDAVAEIGDYAARLEDYEDTLRARESEKQSCSPRQAG